MLIACVLGIELVGLHKRLVSLQGNTVSTVALRFSLPPTSKQPVLPEALWDAKHPKNNEVINCVNDVS